MPELPEVETCRRIIERELTGRVVSSVTVRLPKLLRYSPIPTLDPLIGRRIEGARRRAKILIVDLSDDLSLVIHLKLAGQVSVHRAEGTRHTAGHPVPDPTGLYPHKTTHIELGFDDGSILYLSDVRQFGWLRLLPSGDVESLIATFKLGPDAIGESGAIAATELGVRLKRRSVPIKLALLNQNVLGGVGNIYVDEALHRAKIHPATRANTLTEDEVIRLHEAVQWSLERGVEQGGARIIHGKAYPRDGFPAVHGRKDEACPVCGAVVIKTRVGTRGTYLCPTCQAELPAVTSG
jgi:formamidopyrimidine-DNA glycosylase